MTDKNLNSSITIFNNTVADYLLILVGWMACMHTLERGAAVHTTFAPNAISVV